MSYWRRRQARADIHVAGPGFVTLYTFESEDDGATLTKIILSLAQLDATDPSHITKIDLYRGGAILQTWDLGNLMASTVATVYNSPDKEIPMDVIIRAGDLIRAYSARIATAQTWVSISMDLDAPTRIATEKRIPPFPGCASLGQPGHVDTIAYMGVLGAIAGLRQSERGIWLSGWLRWSTIRARRRIMLTYS